MARGDHLAPEKRAGTDWFSQAACRRMDPEFFFPKPEEVTRVRAICKGCPVDLECLEYALHDGITHGFFGGVGERARMEMRLGRKPIVSITGRRGNIVL